MATVVDSLLVTLGVDSKGVDDGIQAARGKITGGLRNIVSAMAAPLMTAFAGFSAGALTSAYVSQAQGLKQLSDSLGMSMEDLQGWQYAAESAGAEAEEVGNFFRDMNDYIVDATTFDSGPLKDISKELGISLKDAQGNVRDTMDVVLDLSDAFQKVGSQKAVAFGMQMGIDPGMIQLLQKGRAEIEGLIKAQQELGGYTKEDAEIAAKAQFAFMSLGRAIQAAALPVARVLVPMMTKATEKFSEAVAFLRKHEPFVKASLIGVAAIITTMLIPASLKLAAAWIMNPMTWIIGLITAAVAALVIAFDDLYVYMQGGESEFADFWRQFGTGEEIAAKLQKEWKELKASWESFVDTLRSNLPTILRLVAVFGALRVGSKLNSVFGSLAKSIATFGGTAVGAGAKIGSTVKTFGLLRGSLRLLFGVIRANPFGLLITAAMLIYDNWDKIVAVFERVKKAISDAIDTFKEWKEEAKEKVSGAVDSVKNAASNAWDSTKETVAGVGSWFKNTFGFGEEPLPVAAYAGGGNLAAQASHETTKQINATASTRVGTVNVYADNAQNGREIGNAVVGAMKGEENKTLALLSQTGVLQK